ncbi:hypothetical protein DEO72_LG3g1360 [Vigna unguiculata]|uniref:Uncharacterized protein n=1 Tax=Vigna unguiculata TaxID=3917 RepID=A0A4D6LF15_VIGUN|nr:hypothetical protein DEO72_LG3g1360 [Vigna unguiculata]
MVANGATLVARQAWCDGCSVIGGGGEALLICSSHTAAIFVDDDDTMATGGGLHGGFGFKEKKLGLKRMTWHALIGSHACARINAM